MSGYDQALFKPSLGVFGSVTKEKVVCEFAGTFALVYFSNWAYTNYRLQDMSSSSYAVTMGLLMTILIYLGKDISGAIYNPT